MIAVEPCNSAVQSLKTNLTLNGVHDRVEIIEQGASNRVGILRFTTNLDALNQITTTDGPDTTNIRVAPLDDILVNKAPVLIKIDVEGHEKWVIEGATKTFASPGLIAVQIETGDEAVKSNVLAMMEAQGFTACVYAPERRELKVIRALSPHNTLFVKDLAAAQRRVQSAPLVDVYGSFYYGIVPAVAAPFLLLYAHRHGKPPPARGLFCSRRTAQRAKGGAERRL